MTYQNHLLEKTNFRRKLRRGDRLLGTFLKFLSGQPTEILGALGWDFVIIDQEHAPFDRRTTDEAILAARAGGIATIVRTPDSLSHSILNALDLGANGVIVPHVRTAGQAKSIVDAARYRPGDRGFALATRAANWGLLPSIEHIAASDGYVTVIAQIEDGEGLENVEDIAAVDGLDGIFIGRGDLSVALDAAELGAPVVLEACERIIRAARSNGVAVSAFVSSIDEARQLAAVGVQGFLYTSDQALFVGAARAAKSAFDALGGTVYQS